MGFGVKERSKSASTYSYNCAPPTRTFLWVRALYEFALILKKLINVRRKLSLFISSMIHSLIGRFSINMKLMPGLLPS